MDDSMKRKILALLDAHRIMTIATLRPDGWPQATTVGYVSEGLTLWFLCGRLSQKARNLALDNRVSITIDHDTPDILAIAGLSMAARAHRVTDRAEAEMVIGMLPRRARCDRKAVAARARGGRALSRGTGGDLGARLHTRVRAFRPGALLRPHRVRARRRAGRNGRVH